MNAKDYYDSHFEESERFRMRNRYYYEDKIKLMSFLIPSHASVLDIGCGSGDLLSSINAGHKSGIDISAKAIKKAKEKHPGIEFSEGDIESLDSKKTYDYVICADIVGAANDIEAVFKNIRKASHDKSRVIVTFHNQLWQPVFTFLEKVGLKSAQPVQNWVSLADVENLLYLADFEMIKKGRRMLFPKYIPIISWFLNTYVANLPLFSSLCITQYVVARPFPTRIQKAYTVSVVIPARNEKGNIEGLIRRTPEMGAGTEYIFIEGHSKDGTWDEIKRIAEKYGKTKKILIAQQDGKGKGDAVRKGFAMATGDVLMILDADMTVAPEELPKFYEAIATGRADFVNGSRLVYEMEDKAMRFLNILGNKFFATAFSWLLSQRIKDTLCGTKVLFRTDYRHIAHGRTYFGEFDPFGDYDLLFGAAKLNHKIIDLPIRYKERVYGTTQIQRFRHGWLLLQMCAFAAKKIKFI